MWQAMLRWCRLTLLFNARFSVSQSRHNTLIRMQSHDRKKNAIKKKLPAGNVSYECRVWWMFTNFMVEEEKKSMDRTTGKGAHIHNNKLKKAVYYALLNLTKSHYSSVSLFLMLILKFHALAIFFHINFFSTSHLCITLGLITPRSL